MAAGPASAAWHNVKLFQDLPMPKIFKFLAALCALPLILVGCRVNSINYFPPTPAHIRVVNVLGTTTPINVSVNGVTTWSNLPFEAMTGYVDVENVSSNIAVSLAGSTTTLLQQTYNPAGKEFFTLVIYGTLESPTLGVMADVNQPPPSGKFALNVFNAAPTGNGLTLGATSLDIYLTPPGQALDNISPVFNFIRYTTTNIFGQFSSGPYQLRMTVAGTKTLVYDSGPLTFPDQTATDVILYSRGSAVLANVLLNDSDGAAQQRIANSLLSRLKVVNGAFQSGSVNQFLNGVAGVVNLAFATASAYSVVPAGAATVTFEASSTPGATIASIANTLVGATDSSIFVSGFAGSTRATALTDKNSPPGSGSVALRFVNASPNSPPLDVYANGALQARAVGAYAASAYIALAANVATTLSFKDSATQADVLTIASQTFVSDQTFSVYVLGPAGALSGLVTPDTP